MLLPIYRLFQLHRVQKSVFTIKTPVCPCRNRMLRLLTENGIKEILAYCKTTYFLIFMFEKLPTFYVMLSPTLQLYVANVELFLIAFFTVKDLFD